MPQPSMEDIYAMAEACEGVVAWDASQSFAILGEHAGRGICLAASCYYVQLHKAGTSLREFLGMYMEGRTFVPMNMDAMALLQTEQRHMRNFETETFKAWLNYKSGLRKVGYGSGTLDVGAGRLRNSIFAMSDGYMLFEFFDSSDEGHAVAAFFHTSDGETRVSFYDANFGEILFRTQEHFFHFFDYLLTMGYGNDSDSEYDFLHLQ